jgi:molecular chaperone HscB
MAASHQEDPFDLLGLEPTFHLDRALLERAYLVRAASAHPDASGTDGSAAQINEAKRVLEDPERRANALLARLGGPSKEDNRDLPPGFLMEIMETREEMESLAQGDDAEGLARFRELALSRRSGHIDRIGRLFGELASPPTAEGLARIRVELNAWRYAERMIEQIKPHAAAP